MTALATLPKWLSIQARLIRDRLCGRQALIWHLSNFGQAQYLLPILEELERRPARYTHYMAHDSPVGNKDPGLPIPPCRWFPAELAPRLRLVRAFLQPEIYGRGPKGAVKIFVGHGQPNKHTNWSEENLRSFDWYFLYGELEREMFEVVRTDRVESTRHIRLLNIGYPKLDRLIQGKYLREEVLGKLGLPLDRKTVLYAPAWDPGGALRTHGVKVLDALLQRPDINLVVKLHPASLEPPDSVYYQLLAGGIDWSAVMEEYPRRERFRYVRDYVIDPYLAAADVLVTDFSGVALEFMTQDRPVVYLHCPEFYEKTLVEWGNAPETSLKDDRFNAGRNVGVVAMTLEELPEALARALADPPELAAKRRRLMARFLYNPGDGARCAADAIEQACGLSRQ